MPIVSRRAGSLTSPKAILIVPARSAVTLPIGAANMVNIAQLVAVYADTLQQKHRDSLHGDLGYKVEVEEGRKFYKIITVRNRNGTGKSVHSFVNKSTGALYKPASWATPVKDERYNLLTELDLVLAVMDEYGGYLYKDKAREYHQLQMTGGLNG